MTEFHPFFMVSIPLYIYLGEGNDTPLQYSCPENPMDGGAWWAAVHEVAKSQTRLSDFTFTFTFMHWRRKWQPTPVFLPGESHGRRSLVGCSPWGCTESDTTEATWQHIYISISICIYLSICIHTQRVSSLSIHLLMDRWVASISLLL